MLPDIQQQLKILRGNLAVVHDKLDSLIVRAPVTGKVASIDLKVGETPGTGHRLAEITPQTGMKLVADIDEFYLSRVRGGQTATVNVEGKPVSVTVRRVSPQVHNPEVTDEFAKLVLHMLAKKRDDRPRDFHEVLMKLRTMQVFKPARAK